VCLLKWHGPGKPLTDKSSQVNRRNRARPKARKLAARSKAAPRRAVRFSSSLLPSGSLLIECP
jgi:hypothetical protein